jgi:hypothetical protein
MAGVEASSETEDERTTARMNSRLPWFPAKIESAVSDSGERGN